MINHNGYILKKNSINVNKLNSIKKELTIIIKDDTFSIKPKLHNYNLYIEKEDIIYLPRYYGIQLFGYDVNYKYPIPENINLTFSGNLYENQKNIINEIIPKLKNIKNGYGGILCIPTGGGKTTLSLYIISILKVKTLVIVNKEFLLNQWKERILQYLPNTKIGHLQQEHIDIENKDIVIAMIHSISMKNYSREYFKDFGFCIVDEVHHSSSEIFSQIYKKINTKYMLGLSATPKRKDKLEKIFHWYIGPTLLHIKQNTELTVNINIYKFTSNHSNFCIEYNKFTKKPLITKMITNIVKIHERNKLIVDIIKTLTGRKILLLSDRIEHLNIIYDLTKLLDFTIGFYKGGMSKSDLEKTSTCSLILGTYSMASEGLDIKDLDTLILATPKSDIVQSIGRIMRKKSHEYINVPLIIDIYDDLSSFYYQYLKRKKIYIKNNYNITFVNFSDNITKDNKINYLDIDF